MLPCCAGGNARKGTPDTSLEPPPAAAERLGILHDQKVRITSRRGHVEIPASLTDRVAPGTLFLAFHYAEAPADRLTIAALDPVAKIPELKVCAARVEPCAS